MDLPKKRLVLVGTSHIAKQSVEKVCAVIEREKPDIVGVELDMARFQALAQEEKEGKAAKSRFSLYNARQIGFKGFAFGMLGSWGMRKMAKYVGTNPGVDMLEAVKIASKNNIKAVLIDQNIQVTLSKLSKAITMREIGRFFGDIVRGIFRPKKEMKKMGFESFDLNKIPSDELIEKMIGYLKIRYPSLYNVLVQERNIYMVRRIVKLLSQEGVNSMVAVVGAGHSKGMARIFAEQTGIEVVIA